MDCVTKGFQYTDDLFLKIIKRGICWIETMWSEGEDLLTRGADGEWREHLVFFDPQKATGKIV